MFESWEDFLCVLSIVSCCIQAPWGGMICHAPCSSTILSCIYALTWCGIASREWRMFTLYVLIFWLSFRVLLWHTSQSGGADGTRMIDITATVALGVPLAYSCVGFLWTLSYLCSSGCFGILIYGRIWYVLISNGWGLCAFRMLIMC